MTASTIKKTVKPLVLASLMALTASTFAARIHPQPKFPTRTDGPCGFPLNGVKCSDEPRRTRQEVH
jgi:hypothetical protein